MGIDAQLAALRPIIDETIAERLGRWPETLKEDMAAAILVGCWQRLAKFDPLRGSVEQFGRTIIANLLVDEIRKLKTQRPSFVLLPSELAKVDDDTEDARLAQKIRERPSDYLSRRLAEVFAARQEHQSPACAAKSLGMSNSSFARASTRLKVALRALFLSGSTTPDRIPN